MTFDLQKVADYANFISNENEFKLVVQSQNSWLETQKLVVNSYKKFQVQKTPLNYRYFAKALHNAASYLIDHRKPNVKINEERQAFVDDYTNYLILDYRKINPNGKLKPPLPTLEPSFMKEPSSLHSNKRRFEYINLKNSGRDHAPALDKFITSKAFYALNDHLNLVLNEDDRDHSFLGCFDFREERKVTVLNQFITDLKSRRDMNEVRQFLVEFYQGKGKALSSDNKTWNKSAFEILNTGQNITTRFFSDFGIQTTTINLIDKLAQSIGFDPQVTEEIKSRDSKIFSF